MIVGVAATFLAMFQHANIRTPRWIGYIVVRPESHAAHHQRGVHAFNYCDLPAIDMLFGTFRNPPAFEGQAGFWDGASARLGAMLAGRDVSEPPSGDEAPRGLAPAAVVATLAVAAFLAAGYGTLPSA
jgi:hypothetical protein